MTKFYPASGQQFYTCFRRAWEESKFMQTDSVLFPAKSYMFKSCYLSEDNLSGYAIELDGQLVSVFSLVRGRGKSLVASAIDNGAISLECYEAPLKLYESAGFVVVERLQLPGLFKYIMELEA